MHYLLLGHQKENSFDLLNKKREIYIRMQHKIAYSIHIGDIFSCSAHFPGIPWIFLAFAAWLPLLMNYLIFLEPSKRIIHQKFVLWLLDNPCSQLNNSKIFIWSIFIAVKWETLGSSFISWNFGLVRSETKTIIICSYNFWQSYKGERKKKWRKPGVENSCVPLFAGTQSK